MPRSPWSHLQRGATISTRRLARANRAPRPTPSPHARPGPPHPTSTTDALQAPASTASLRGSTVISLRTLPGIWFQRAPPSQPRVRFFGRHLGCACVNEPCRQPIRQTCGREVVRGHLHDNEQNLLGFRQHSAGINSRCERDVNEPDTAGLFAITRAGQEMSMLLRRDQQPHLWLAARFAMLCGIKEKAHLGYGWFIS